MKQIKTVLMLLATLGALTGCGGGGGGGGDTSIAGIDRLGASAGTVTGFGSIFVNGVEFETNGAEFTIDDSPGSESDLDVGDVVIVIGSINSSGSTGTADTVFADEAVEGPIDNINLAASQMTVAGQLVLISASTSFDDGISPATLDGLAVGNFVEVSGFFDADRNIRATRIERKAISGIPAGETVEVHGFVTNLSASSFQINGLTIDFSSAVLDNFPGGAIANGDFVEAKGLSFAAGGELIATRVELEAPGAGGIDLNNIDDLEVEGFITRFVSATDFDVSSLPVTTNAQTVFEFEDDTPAMAADLGLNVKVEVEGDVNSSGVLVADKVEIKRAAVIRITANIDSVNLASNSFVILGVEARVDSLTRLEDKSDQDDETLTLAELATGDYVEMRGAVDANGSADVIAERVEREDPELETIIQGFVETVGEPTLTILGVTVETNSQTIFRDANDNLFNSATEFFNAVAEGSIVKAKGLEVSSTTVVAEEVELENES